MTVAGVAIVDAKQSAKHGVLSDGFSPTMAAVWEHIEGDHNLGQEIQISINAVTEAVDRTRPMVVKALLQLSSRGYLQDLTPDPRSNVPHTYRVCKARVGISEEPGIPDR